MYDRLFREVCSCYINHCADNTKDTYFRVKSVNNKTTWCENKLHTDPGRNTLFQAGTHFSKSPSWSILKKIDDILNFDEEIQCDEERCNETHIDEAKIRQTT